MRVIAYICTGALLCSNAMAQTKRVIPASVANVDGNSSTPYFSGYGAGRVQQVIIANRLAKNIAIIRELALRGDGSPMTAQPGRSFTNTKFWMGYTTVTPSSMSSNFAKNRTSKLTLMFTGNLNLPALNTTSRPFNIVWKLPAPWTFMPKTGNLLLEWEVPGQATKSRYFLDAHVGKSTAGSCSTFGSKGSFAKPENYTVTCPSPQAMNPGGKLEFMTASFSKQYPAIVAWGFSNKQFGPIKLPFDLKTLGAPGNFLNVSIDLAFPLIMRIGRGGFEARAALPIPNDPIVRGLTLYTQGIFVDTAANQLGLVFSEGLAMTISSGPFGQLLGHWDSNSATGSMSRNTGLVVQFDGIFN